MGIIPSMIAQVSYVIERSSEHVGRVRGRGWRAGGSEDGGLYVEIYLNDCG